MIVSQDLDILFIGLARIVQALRIQALSVGKIRQAAQAYSHIGVAIKLAPAGYRER